ncbi:MAG: group-specific protein [Clostridia bacterium]|nr:group-specific protein [Clostridia bacterium]
MKRFYIASSLKNSELVNYYSKILEKNGWKHTYNWTKNINDVKNMENLIENAKLEQNAIINSDIVIVLFPAGRGTHIELGMSLALNKKIYLCSNKKDEFNFENTVAFYQIPNIIKLVGTPDENLKEIIKIESKNN